MSRVPREICGTLGYAVLMRGWEICRPNGGDRVETVQRKTSTQQAGRRLFPVVAAAANFPSNEEDIDESQVHTS